MDTMSSEDVYSDSDRADGSTWQSLASLTSLPSHESYSFAELETFQGEEREASAVIS